MLVGGLYWKKASSTGAFWALIAGSSAILGLGPIYNRINALLAGIFPPDIYSLIKLSGARATLLSVCLTTVVLIVVSLLFPDKKSHASAVKELVENEQ